MTPRAKLGLSAFLPIAVFAPTGWLIGSLAGLTGVSLWIVRLGFVLLGAVVAAVIYWFLKKDEDELAPADAGTPAARIDAVIAEARRRVASAGGPRKASFGELPLVLALGPPGSTKTTSIVRSGLEPELLAGEVLRGDAVPPTDGANVWYSQGALIVEAGGVVTQDRDAWARLARRVRPRRVGAALARGAQAPRSALVCVSCDTLLAPDALETLPGLARDLRARLVELSDALGIRLPVYVLFTKADRIPHFDDFVRHLTNEEARRAVGSILPVTEPVSAGAYADRQFARVNAAYERLVRALALRRLKLLPREPDSDRAALAYEFPREVGKLRERAVGFLVELCRPSELRVSPFLRGYHFTGVRPVVVSDAAPAAPAAQSAAPGSVDATMVFDALAAQRAAAPPPPSGSGTRRIPQWVFLERLFREAILQDRVAQTVSAGGTGVTAWRRGLLVAAAVIGVVLWVGLTTSFIRNRGLHATTTAAIQDLSLEVSDPQRAASLTSLTRLDSLRRHASTLGQWDREGAPLSYRWGLYSGAPLHRAVRTAYFETFDQLLFRRTRTSLAEALRSLPQEPDEGSEYGEIYDALKAYLITLRHPERSTASFLGPTLLQHWRGGDYVDEERLAIARRQFEFFGEELARGTPYPGLEADDAVVSRARSFLLEFGQADPFYRSLVSEASQATESVRLESAVLTGALELRGAFTRDGWAYVRGRLGDPESLLRTEEWVLGPGAPVPDAAILVEQLDSTYRNDFSDRWEAFLASASVVAFSNPRDAAGKLDRLAASDSPLLELLLMASENTASAAEDVVERFQPVYVLAPPDSAGEATVGGAVQQYLDAIAGVGNAMNAVAQADRSGQAGAVGGARAQIGNARQALRDATQDFSRDPEAASVARAIRALLSQPIDQSDRLLGRLAVELPSREINQRGAAFCREFGQLVSGFPFTRDLNAPDATLQDVAAAFQPGSSALWSLYDESLQPLLDSRGDRYVARAGGPVTVAPEFVDFFDRAARVSRMFYRSPGDDRPEVDFSFRPRFSERVQELTLMVDGVTNQFSPVSNQTLVLSWDGDPGEVRLLGRVDGVERTLLGPFSGSWALFRLFLAADEWARDGSRYVVTWSLPIAGGANLDLEADVEAPAAFAAGDLASLRCQGRIAR